MPSQDPHTRRRSSTGAAPLRLLFVLAAGLLLGGLGGYLIGLRKTPAPARHAAAQPPPPSAPRTLYTCGMHPEVISEEPGLCPKCEMKLTPMDPDRARLILEARGEGSATPAPPAGERNVLYYRSPMDPAFIRNEPGADPMGMDLVPVYEDEVAGGPSIRIDPVTEQNMGLRYDVVRVGPLRKTFRTVGTVQYDEQSLGTVTTKVEGWVEKVHVQETGTQVHAGDPLFDLYSPQLFSAQEEYLTALRDVERSSGTAADLARTRLRSAEERLRLFDIRDEQIDQLRTTGEISRTMTIHADLTGIVIERKVTEGDMLTPGMPAYRIADISTVWVIGRIYESDLPFVRLGQEALMRLDYLPGRTWRGRVTYIYPYLPEGTREVPVRMEFHNPGYELKPGMYATIHLETTLAAEAVLAPAMAVIDTGERQIAFVAREPGKFEPRRVQTGARNDRDEIQVLAGLAPGERVVVSGQFLLDSESRLREATLKMLQPGLVQTSEVLDHGAEPAARPGAMAFERGTDAQPDAVDPVRYVCPMPSHAGILYDQPGDCPLCAMKLVPVRESDRPPAWVAAHWTCPMPEHAHIEAEGPGNCPECGMTLIPVIPSAEAAKKSESVEATAGESAGIALYVCPMESHMHIVSDQPGRCPECNMVLVPTSEVPFGKESELIWRALHGAGDEPTTSSAGAR
ncbi:MAG TPA: efflux RND transporter periplasmic adaptor subunit [Candidatus Sumerlaeota bacterium]|nr:efflux RND transporter periplasmic adaptor subunit [Candidatus Sumerlaeota bacterium]